MTSTPNAGPSYRTEKARTDFIEKIARGLVATGISSKAMAWAALEWSDGVGTNMPLDSGDWRRCVDTYVHAPPHLRKRMEPIMATYCERLLAWTEKYGGVEWRLRNVEWPLPTPAGKGSEALTGPHRVIGEFSGDPSCAVCHHSWPCPTAKGST